MLWPTVLKSVLRTPAPVAGTDRLTDAANVQKSWPLALPSRRILPSLTDSAFTSQPSVDAASASNSARTSAQACRSATPPNCIDWLPAV